MRLSRFLVVLTVLLTALPMFAQVTAGLTGTVMMDNNPLPGATVTITSPNMQGSRTTTSDVNGNYNFAALPPGTYKVVIEMQGMQTITRNVLIGVGQVARADATLKMSSVAEAITVTAAAPAVMETTEIQTNMQQSVISKLPTSRTVTGVALLAPGTVANGPRNALVISGATADQNLIMVDGAVIQENLRGQTHALFIEDAIQETTVLTGAISAEYGRFQGGVVNSITKSGGNEFHGSYRDNMSNPAWQHASAFGEARAAVTHNQVHEATLGGRIIRDRLWFFGAGRKTKSSTPSTFAQSAALTVKTFPVVTDEKRWEGKLTGQITPKYSLVATYLKVPLTASNNCQLGCLDSLTLDPSIQQGNDFKTAHFNGVVTNNWLIESLYSRKTFTFIGFGGINTDPYIGSPFLEFTPTGTRLGTAHAPYFCGVCGDETRNNNAWNLKSTYFWSTKGLGTHNIVGGYERWSESRFSNNYQSPTNFTINTYQEANGFHRDAAGLPLAQVRGSTPGTNSWITYFPILTPSLGSDLRTKSGFFNDKWDLNTHWSFNVGGRFDKNQSVDSLHQKTSDDSAFSPRVGLNYDILGNGKYRVTAGYNVYVGRLAEGINGSGSPAGSPASFVYEYRGPDFASVTSEAAVKIMMDWFLGHGGVSPANNHLCTAADTSSVCILSQNIPGAQTQLLGTLKSPNVREYTIGGGMQIGNGFIRADYLDRDWRDFYVTLTSLQTGTVVINGNTLTRNLVSNSSALTRTYKGIQSQFQYRVMNNINVGGNYTYSKLKGNAIQENVGSGPVTDGGWILTFPEYQGFTLNKPVGYLDADQTHKFRGWVAYDLHTFFGNFNFSAVQRLDSGLPFSALATVDDRFRATFYCLSTETTTAACQAGSAKTDISGGIVNPGYASAPPGSVNYFVRPRGDFRLNSLRATDLATTYSIGWHGAEVYAEGYVFNVFNTQKVVNTQSGATSTINTAIRTAITDPSVFRRFNPFTDTPVQCPALTNGVATTNAQCVALHANYMIPLKWSQGGTFGAPTNKDAYQQPRTYQMALGLRF